MQIDKIVDSIKKVIETVRLPAKEIPSILLICSMARRPGLSLIASMANVVKDMNKLGIPTGSLPDGSVNLSVGYAMAQMKEMQRSIREDAKGELAIMPGSLAMAGVGAGTNATPGKGYVIIH